MHYLNCSFCTVTELKVNLSVYFKKQPSVREEGSCPCFHCRIVARAAAAFCRSH